MAGRIAAGAAAVATLTLAGSLLLGGSTVASVTTDDHVASAHAAVDVLADDLSSAEAEIARLQAIIDAFPTASPSPSPSPSASPSPSPEPCVGTPVTSAAEINGAPAGATLCLTTEIRLTAPVTLKSGQTLTGGGTLNGSILLPAWAPDGGLWVATGRTEGPTELCMAGLNPCSGTEMLVPHARFADDVFYDDGHLIRTATLAALRTAVEPSFFFDYGADRIYVNRDPNGHTLELAVASGIITEAGDGVTIRDITVEKSKGTGIMALGGQDWLYERVLTRLHHGSGVRMGGGSTFTDGWSVWNGMLGMGGSGGSVDANGDFVEPITVTGSEVAFNDAARYQKAPNGGCWSAGALKWTHAVVDFTGNYSHHNFCDGFWADNDVSATVVGNTFEFNLRLGIFIELQNDGGTFDVIGNTITNNGADGIRFSDAGNTIVEDNDFGANVGVAVATSDSSRAGTPTGIAILNNRLHGDELLICAQPGITCEGNVP